MSKDCWMPLRGEIVTMGGMLGRVRSVRRVLLGYVVQVAWEDGNESGHDSDELAPAPHDSGAL